jgi:hypothetical protein
MMVMVMMIDGWVKEERKREKRMEKREKKWAEVGGFEGGSVLRKVGRW